MSERRFDGAVALITGGTSGIGRMTALSFARKGAMVVIASRGAERGEAVRRELDAIGAKAEYILTDVNGLGGASHNACMLPPGGRSSSYEIRSAGVRVKRHSRQCARRRWLPHSDVGRRLRARHQLAQYVASEPVERLVAGCRWQWRSRSSLFHKRVAWSHQQPPGAGTPTTACRRSSDQSNWNWPGCET
jgi:short chain dehydrogenase